MKKFEYFFLTTFFFFPIIPRYLGVDLGGGLPIINAQRILLANTYIVWMFKKLISGKLPYQKTAINRAIFFLAFVQILSVFNHPTIFLPSALKILQLIMEQYLIFYLVVDIVRTKEQLQRLVFTLVISMLIVSLIGIVEYYSGNYFFSFIKPVREELQSAYNVAWMRLGSLRIQSSLASGRVLGMSILILFPFSLMFSFYETDRVKKFIWSFASIIFFITLMFTKSRASMMGIFLSLIILYPIYKNYFLKFLGAVFFLLFSWVATSGTAIFQKISLFKVMIISVFNPAAFVNTQYDELGISAYSRIATQLEALGLIADRPLLGYGLSWPSSLITTGSDINWFTGVMLESGVISMILFLIIITIVIRSLLKIYRSAATLYYKYFSIAVIGSVVSFCIPLLTGLSRDAFYLLYIAFAVAEILTRLNTDELIWQNSSLVNK